jgi:hypothetical protein
MSGRRSRDKGARTERAMVRLLQAQGIAATKISGIYKPGADISMSLLGSDKAVEVKARADSFRQLYDWLHNRDVLIVKSDHREPLVVVRLSLGAEIVKAAASDATPRPNNPAPLRDSLQDAGAAK